MIKYRNGPYSCSDRMCGATDCQTCYPGNKEGQVCVSCDEVFEECLCGEDGFEAAEDCDDYDPREERDDDDYWDQVSNDYEDKMGF